jgi:phage tail sheath protein FI
LWLPASSSVAGVCARSDDTTAPWYSPAGYNRGQLKGVVKLAHIPRQTDRDELYSNRINPLVTFPGEGTILYGDKTALAKPSAFDRINVRRLFITLERAISNSAKYLLFEFNDASTRALFVSMVEPYLRNVQGLRGIQNFHVVCDETNNTPFVIDSNQFVGDIYIKPNRSINFITLNFVAVRTGVSFTEIATGEYGTNG